MRGAAGTRAQVCARARAQVKEKLKLLMGAVHSAVTVACAEYFERFRRHVYVTPRSYLAFLSGYRELYGRKLAATRALAAAIKSGLAKMSEAKVDVNRMKARGARLALCGCTHAHADPGGACVHVPTQARMACQKELSCMWLRAPAA